MIFTPGSLVTARGREWVVLGDSDPELLMVRPLGGGDEETTGILTQVEQVEPAGFAMPNPATDLGDAQSARLLRDALRLGFRSGAGPFRSAGRIAVQPRPYQLVPLLMALRLDPVRMLIADDVGVGKTIEAGLVARELLESGDARQAGGPVPSSPGGTVAGRTAVQVPHRGRVGAGFHHRPAGTEPSRWKVAVRDGRLLRGLARFHQVQASPRRVHPGLSRTGHS